MALPTISGVATLFTSSRDEDDFTITEKGSATFTRVTLAFQKSHFDERKDEWVVDGKISIYATAFDELAEYIVDNLAPKDRVPVTATIETNMYETKDGEDRMSVQGVIQSIGKALPVKKGKGGGDYG